MDNWLFECSWEGLGTTKILSCSTKYRTTYELKNRFVAIDVTFFEEIRNDTFYLSYIGSLMRAMISAVQYLIFGLHEWSCLLEKSFVFL